MNWEEREKREREWLANLKVGDEVAVCGGWNPTLERVTRETPRFWIVCGNKYRKEDGRGIGGGHWSHRSLREPTQDIKDDAEERKLRNELGRVVWSKVPLAKLRAVRDVLAVPDPEDKEL